MKSKTFDKLVADTLHSCESVMTSKEEEYSSGKDRFHNFKVAARMKGCTPIEALEGMKLKHDVSVKDLIDNPDTATERLLTDKIGDSINYLLLLKGLLIEHMEKKQINPHIQTNFKNLPFSRGADNG